VTSEVKNVNLGLGPILDLPKVNFGGFRKKVKGPQADWFPSLNLIELAENVRKTTFRALSGAYILLDAKNTSNLVNHVEIRT
jgi:hypothetical protein